MDVGSRGLIGNTVHLAGLLKFFSTINPCILDFASIAIGENYAIIGRLGVSTNRRIGREEISGHIEEKLENSLAALALRNVAFQYNPIHRKQIALLSGFASIAFQRTFTMRDADALAEPASKAIRIGRRMGKQVPNRTRLNVQSMLASVANTGSLISTIRGL